jgi:hypothetical protein
MVGVTTTSPEIALLASLKLLLYWQRSIIALGVRACDMTSPGYSRQQQYLMRRFNGHNPKPSLATV